MIFAYLNGELYDVYTAEDMAREPVVRTALNRESTLSFAIARDSVKGKRFREDLKLEADGRMYTVAYDGAMRVERGEKAILEIEAQELQKDLEAVFPMPFLSNDPTTPVPSDFTVMIVGGGRDLTNGAYPVGSAAHAMAAVLQGTGWTLGTADVDGVFDLEVEKKSVLGLLQEIQHIWGGYLVFDSKARVVHLRDEKKWKNAVQYVVHAGRYVKIAKEQVERTYRTVFPFGERYLDIASVNSGVKGLTNPEVAGGMKIVTNEKIKDAAELKRWGEAQLAFYSRPRFHYTCDIVDVRYLPGLKHEVFALGDVVRLQPENEEETDDVRIIAVEYPMLMPWKVRLEIGEPLVRLEDVVKAAMDATSVVAGLVDGLGQIDGAKLKAKSVIGDAIDDAAMDASKFNVRQVILSGEKFLDHPAQKEVSWNAHALFYEGVKYEIPAGRTKEKYILWRYGAKAYTTMTEAAFDAAVLGDNDWVIAVNNGGVHDVQWYSRLSRQFIGAVFIADAAITDAKVHDLSAVKLVTGRVQSVDGRTWIDLDTGAFSFQGALRWENGALVIDSPKLDEKIEKVSDEKVRAMEKSIRSELDKKVEEAKSHGKLWHVANLSDLREDGLNGKTWKVLTPEKPENRDHAGDIAVVGYPQNVGDRDAYYNAMYLYTLADAKWKWVQMFPARVVEEDKKYNGVKISSAGGVQIYNNLQELKAQFTKDDIRFYHSGDAYSFMDAKGIRYHGPYGDSAYLRELYIQQIDNRPGEALYVSWDNDEALYKLVPLPRNFQNYDAKDIEVMFFPDLTFDRIVNPIQSSVSGELQTMTAGQYISCYETMKTNTLIKVKMYRQMYPIEVSMGRGMYLETRNRPNLVYGISAKMVVMVR